jgi:hypothetical protein
LCIAYIRVMSSLPLTTSPASLYRMRGIRGGWRVRHLEDLTLTFIDTGLA